MRGGGTVILENEDQHQFPGPQLLEKEEELARRKNWQIPICEFMQFVIYNYCNL